MPVVRPIDLGMAMRDQLSPATYSVRRWARVTGPLCTLRRTEAPWNLRQAMETSGVLALEPGKYTYLTKQLFPSRSLHRCPQSATNLYSHEPESHNPTQILQLPSPVDPGAPVKCLSHHSKSPETPLPPPSLPLQSLCHVQHHPSASA